MKRFITLVLLTGLVMLTGFLNEVQSQSAQSISSAKGVLVRITPKLSEIDKTTMYGQPLVITRGEKGLLAHQTEEWIAAKKAFKEQLYKMEGKDEPTYVPEAIPTRNVPTTAINYNADGLTATGFAPSDCNMAVGPNHILQMINHSSGSLFTIRSKTGTVLLAPTILSTVTGQTGGGDPVVVYDYLADRWLISEFDAVGANGGALNIAVSTTASPLGSWAVYRYTDVSFFPDYPKYGIWHNAYYATSQDFAPSFIGSSIWAFDKAAMIAGNPTANMVRVRLNLSAPLTTWGIIPVSLEGTVQSNQSGLFAYTRDNNLAPATPADSVGIIQFTPNFANPPASIVAPSNNMASLAFNLGTSTAPTPGGGSVGTLAGKTMFKVSYRNFGTHESIVLAVTAGVGGVNAIKWWELRRTGGAGNWSIFQDGVYAPGDGIHRFMPAITISSNGNIGLLYNASSTTVQGSLRYTGRNACDPPGQMTLAEQIVIAGTANNPANARYGDYNSLALDPVISNSFWGTGQYSTSAFGTFQNWGTRIVNFTLGGSCAPIANIIPDGYTLISESCVPANGAVDPGETVTVAFALRNNGTAATTNAVGTLQATGGVVSPSGPQNYGAIPVGGSVSRNFTFTNNLSTCGASITASIQVQDGPDNLGTVTYSIPTGAPITVVNENFDAVAAPALPAGWIATNASGPAPLWVTSNSGTPTPANFSAPNAAFVDDPGVVSDKRLETPVFVPGSGATVSFRRNNSLETGFDGAVLEISINAGAYVDITSLAGGAFTAGGYTHTISSGFSNPIGGRQAWSGSTGSTYVLTTATLPSSAAGQNVRLRFRMGSDNIIGAQGIRIDNLSISQLSCCGAPCVLTCPANMTVATSGSQCGTNVSFTIGSTGLCGLITAVPASGSFFPVGTTTVNVSSASGATCSFTVTVTDGTPPTITCPANISVSNAPGLCSQTVNYPFPTVGDNCPLTGGTAVTLNQSVNTTTITPIQIGCQAGGLTTENSWWRAYNLAPLNLPSGLTVSSVRFGIERSQFATGSVTGTIRIWRSNGAFPAASRTLLSTQPVVIANQTGTFMTVNLSSPASFAPTDIAVVELNIPEGRFAPNAGTFFIGSNALGETAPSYLSAAACGVPTPTPIGDLVPSPLDHIHLSMVGQYFTTPPTLQFISGIGRGGVFPVGTTTERWRATDAVGNTSECTFTVTVNDTELPVFTLCPANQVRTTDVNQCYATFTPPQPTFTDNCGVTALTYVITQPTGFPPIVSPATGINFVPSTQFQLLGRTGVGVSTIVYTARDLAGNVRTCTFTVTVNDGQIPTITTQPATQFVCVGSNANFPIVVTTNGGPITYRWQEWNTSANPGIWSDVPGGNAATLTIPSVSFNDNTRTFRCFLLGRCSDVISGVASLYVNPLPTVTLVTSRPPALVPGQVLNISSNVSLSGGTYRWFKNGVMLTSPLQQLPVLSGLTVDDIGTYHLVYTDPNGCVGISANVVVTGQSSNNLWVYPVPNNGTFQVRFFNSANEGATVRVFDAKGSKVYERAVVTNLAYTRIDVDLGPAIADGVYIVELVNSGGKRIGVKKIVVRQKP